MNTNAATSDALSAASPRPPRKRRLDEMSSRQLLIWQTALAFSILACWQFASGRLVDNFFISNPVEVTIRLWEWTITGFIFPHLWVTFYETVAGFMLGSLIGALLGVGYVLWGVAKVLVIDRRTYARFWRKKGAELAAANAIRLVALGDSTFQGLGATRPPPTRAP